MPSSPSPNLPPIAIRPMRPFYPTGFDHNGFDEELPPELFDEDEDLEDIAAFIHMAEGFQLDESR